VKTVFAKILHKLQVIFFVDPLWADAPLMIR